MYMKYKRGEISGCNEDGLQEMRGNVPVLIVWYNSTCLHEDLSRMISGLQACVGEYQCCFTTQIHNYTCMRCSYRCDSTCDSISF